MVRVSEKTRTRREEKWRSKEEEKRPGMVSVLDGKDHKSNYHTNTHSSSDIVKQAHKVADLFWSLVCPFTTNTYSLPEYSIISFWFWNLSSKA